MTGFDLARLHGLRRRGRSSLKIRTARWRSKRWQIVQCALAASVAYVISRYVLHHTQPVFAPIAAVVSLGTSYGQRLRRVAEVSVGVGLGVFIGDLLVAWLGQGWWQLGLMVALAFTVATLLDAGTLFQNQAAVQSIFVMAVLPASGAIWTRWTDAFVGGLVALCAATVVPAAPLMRPRQQAAIVARKISELLRASAKVMLEGPSDAGYDVLAQARATDKLVAELKAAADEGMAVVASSPFRVRHRENVRRMADLVDPLDRALRSTRVLVRQVAAAAHRGREVPASYASLAYDLADATDAVAQELNADRVAEAVRPALLAVAEASGAVERSNVLNAEAILAQLRSVIVDLLTVAGMDPMEATDALPPPRH